MNPLLTTALLDQWATRIVSQQHLPLMMLRLILGTQPECSVSFPFGDSINTPGYDGVIQNATQHQFIPEGNSVWEVSTRADIGTKANEDYDGRTSKPLSVSTVETTFVFVTPRVWRNKTDWVAEKRSQGIWKDVQVIDGLDLIQWLERIPAVSAWATELIVGRPLNIRNLNHVWESCASRTNPHLIPDVLLAGQGSTIEYLTNFFPSTPSVFRLRSRTTEEGIDFLAAYVHSLQNQQQREAILSRTLLIESSQVWDQICSHSDSLTLIGTPTNILEPNRAVERGHRVILLYSNSESGMEVTSQLGVLNRSSLEEALVRMGHQPEEARSLARNCRGSFTTLLDLLNARHLPPVWSQQPDRGQLLPLLLVGSWNQNSIDLGLLANLAQVPVETIEAQQVAWSGVDDPPIQCVSGVWQWVSRVRAWPHFVGQFTHSLFTRFESVARQALIEIDPVYNIPPDDRWMSGFRTLPPHFSETLRRGIAETLVLIATNPGSNQPTTRLRQFSQDWVNHFVRTLFGQTPNPALWFSTHRLYRPLAEAAPEAFLDCVEAQVVNCAEVREELFREQSNFGGSRHTELLCALETLGWFPQYLSQVALILAGLAQNDPGGQSSNRPINSLALLFLDWNPQTLATADQRIAALRSVYRCYPNEAFRTIIEILSGEHRSVHPHLKPRLRELPNEPTEGITYEQMWSYQDQLLDLAILWTGSNLGRWAQLLPHVDLREAEVVERVLTQLEFLGINGDQTPSVFRESLRSILFRSLSPEGNHPQLNQQQVDRFCRVYQRAQPADLVERHRWLFSSHPTHPSDRHDSWEVAGEELGRDRLAAIEEILHSGGVMDVVRLAETSQLSGVVGYMLASTSFQTSNDFDLLHNSIGSTNASVNSFVRSFIAHRFHQNGLAWVRSVFQDSRFANWSIENRVTFAQGLPFRSETWDWLSSLGEELETAYWTTTLVWVTLARSDAERAIRSCLDRGCPFRAFHYLQASLYSSDETVRVPIELRVEVLRALTAVATGNAPIVEELPNDAHLGHNLAELIQQVDNANIIPEEEVARMEWVWMDALQHTQRGLVILRRVICREPTLFVDLIRTMFFPERTDDTPRPEPDEQTLQMGRRAFRLLFEWRDLPGLDSEGNLDSDHLRSWVSTARTLLAESGHGRVGDSQLGQILANSPNGTDEIWPHETIREFLEDIRSESLESGLSCGIVNLRGMTCRSPDAGGEQEYRLEERYQNWASALIAYPRTAAVLRRVANSYRHDAQREDDRRDYEEYSD